MSEKSYNNYNNLLVDQVFSSQGKTDAKSWHRILKREFPDNKPGCNYNLFLYIIATKYSRTRCKFGVSTNPYQRLRALQQGNGFTLVTYNLWCDTEPDFIKNLEDKIRNKFSAYKLSDITGQTSGHSEWLYIHPRLMVIEINRLYSSEKIIYYNKLQQKKDKLQQETDHFLNLFEKEPKKL